MTAQAAATVQLIFQSVMTLVVIGLGIWAVRGLIIHRTTFPRMGSVLVTHEDLTKWCVEHQASCLSSIGQRMDVLGKIVDRRLEEGDKVFAEHRARLREHEIKLALATKALEDLEVDLKAGMTQALATAVVTAIKEIRTNV